MEKKRHGCLTAYLIFMIVVCTLGAGVYFLAGNFVAQGNPEIPAGLRPVFGIINLCMVGCAIALWKFRKWGFWAFVAIGVLGGILNTYLSHSILAFLMVPISLLIMYGILHIGKENQGWKQLD
jgi:hypothetical protein